MENSVQTSRKNVSNAMSTFLMTEAACSASAGKDPSLAKWNGMKTLRKNEKIDEIFKSKITQFYKHFYEQFKAIL